MKRILAVLFTVLFVSAVGGAAPPVDARTKLNGTYAFTGVRSCTIANAPFANDASGSPTLVPPSGAFHQVATEFGVTTFNSDGTGTNTGRISTSNFSNTAPNASILSVSEVSNSFTYTVNADDTVDISDGGTTFRTVLGGGAGDTGTVEPRSSRLQIGNGANTLVGVPDTQIVQEIVHFNSSSVPQYRVCTRSITRVKM